MNLDNLNNLIELFANQANKQNKKDIFLEWLNPINKKTYTWEQTEKNILKLSKVIKENIKEGDRCLLVSENRPEWFVSDLAIMVAGGITVPAYTTYTEDDYKYLIEDCEPSLVVVSNNEMLKKLNNSTRLFKLSKFIISWWAKRESNSHFLRNTILSRARLPVPPFALGIQLNYI